MTRREIGSLKPGSRIYDPDVHGWGTTRTQLTRKDFLVVLFDDGANVWLDETDAAGYELSEETPGPTVGLGT